MGVEITSDEASCNGDIWEGYAGFDEKDHAIAELNGRRRDLSVLRKTSEFSPVLNWKAQSDSSLHSRSVVCKSSTSTLLRPMEAGGSVEGKVVIEWGKPDGPSVSGRVSAEVHDEKGNYAKVEVKQDSEGKGSAEVSAGHKEESK